MRVRGFSVALMLGLAGCSMNGGQGIPALSAGELDANRAVARAAGLTATRFGVAEIIPVREPHQGPEYHLAFLAPEAVLHDAGEAVMRASSDSIVVVTYSAQTGFAYIIDRTVTPGVVIAWTGFDAAGTQTNSGQHTADDGHVRFVPTPNAGANERRTVRLTTAIGQGWTLTGCTIFRAD